MPQNFKQTQNHRFSWDLHHPTPLRRGFISQNIFVLRTVHMGVTGTLIFRLTKQIEHILRNLRFFWDSSHVNILEPWKKYQNFRLVPCTVHRPWQKFVRKINFFKIFFDFNDEPNSDYMHAKFRQNQTNFDFQTLQGTVHLKNEKLSNFEKELIVVLFLCEWVFYLPTSNLG